MTTRHAPHPRAPRGVSLLETAIVVAVIAIVGATAVPSFTALLESRRLESAALRLAADLQLARSEAMTRNRSLRFSVRAGADATCWVVHTGAVADCTCAASGVACANGAFAVQSGVLANRDRVALSSNASSIVFDPLHGTSTPTATLRLVGARGRAVHHVVNVLGRVRSCSPEGLVPRYPAC